MPPDGTDGRDLLYTKVSGPVFTGVWGRRAGHARRDVVPAVYAGLDPGAAADRRERDALAAEAAEAVQADLFITERPYLFQSRAASGTVSVSGGSWASRRAVPAPPAITGDRNAATRCGPLRPPDQPFRRGAHGLRNFS